MGRKRSGQPKCWVKNHFYAHLAGLGHFCGLDVLQPHLKQWYDVDATRRHFEHLGAQLIGGSLEKRAGTGRLGLDPPPTPPRGLAGFPGGGMAESGHPEPSEFFLNF